MELRQHQPAERPERKCDGDGHDERGARGRAPQPAREAEVPGELKNNLLGPNNGIDISVSGVFSDCTENGCLYSERWECYFSYKNEYSAGS